MKPYFSTKNGDLYHGDCLEVMQHLDIKADLCLTDPPYGIGVAKNGTVGGGSLRGETTKFKISKWDNYTPEKDVFDKIRAISYNSIIWGGNYFASKLSDSRCWLIWYKRDGLPERTFADCELAWTSFDQNAKVYNIRWDGFIRDSKEKKVAHPTQKPINLFKMCINDFSKEGDLIFDPFFGSGTTGVACEMLGRRWIGIEQDESYCEIAAKRIKKASEQFGLFEG